MPISCHLYDQLEVAAMRKQKVRLRFEPPHSETVFEGVITDVFSRNGEEFFKAKNGDQENLVWPLEGLVSIEILKDTK
jgi:transcriptional antiterminator Rof (Rho-off)